METVHEVLSDAAQGALAQLAFEMGNPDAANTIYITDNPAVNQLTLAITVNVGAAAFTPGQLVPKNQAPQAQGSLLYLDLSALQLTTAEFNALSCSADDWEFELFADNFLIGMTPTFDISLASGVGDSIDITIDGLVLNNPPAAPNVSLNVTSFRVDPVSSGKLPQVAYFKVLLQNAPSDQKDLHMALSCELESASDIINSIDGYDPVVNSISFLLKPGPIPATVKAGPQTVFTVSFVYAETWPGYGALTTPAAAGKIKVRAGQNASNWTISQNEDQQNPCWLMVPPDGQPIVSGGAKSLVEFDIDQIVTTFEPGPTLMFVQYQQVPGYNDGSFYIVLNKIPHVAIDELTVTPNPATVKDGKATVTISWKARNYKLLALMPFYKDVTEENSYTVALTSSQDITLVASGAGDPSNTVMKTVTADVLPAINSFVATPNIIYKKDFPHEVKFYWEVDTNEDVYLLNVRDNTKEPVDKSGTLFKSVKAPGMWSIVPKSPTQLYSLRRNVMIQAFGQEGKNQAINFIPLKVVASPGAQFVAAINQAASCVEILNSLTYDRYSDPIPVDGKPVDIQFSNDGGYLFIADDGGHLTVVGVVYNEVKGAYIFTVLTTVVLDYTPVQIAVAQGSKYVFISSNSTEDREAHLLVIQKIDDSVFAMKSDIHTGMNAGGLCLDPTGALIYIANTDSNTVSVIGYNALSDSFQFVRDITGIQSQPTDVAVADPLGNTLLVVCKGTDTLLVVDHDDRGSSDRQELKLGTSPQYIDTTSSRAYAFITNTSSNTVTLVSCGGGVNNCKVLEQNIATVKQPSGVSLSPDDAMVFIASSQEKSLTVLNLNNYEMQRSPTAVGQFPTGVEISSDNKSVVAWHNAFISTQGGAPYSKGIYVYNVATGTVINKMDTVDVISCVFSPLSPVKKLFLIQKDDNNIQVLDATSFAPQLKIPIPDSSTGDKRLPINITISDDGINMFLLVKGDKGQYSLVVYDCDINTNSYTVIADMDLFVSTVKSNTLLLANAPDGSVVFVLDAFEGNVYTVRRSQKGGYAPDKQQLTIKSIARSMVVSPDNSTLYILAQANLTTSFTIVNAQTLAMRDINYPSSYQTLINLQQMCISPDGSRLFITDADITGVRVVSTATLRIIQTLSWQQDIRFPQGITMLPDGSSIYLACLNSNNIAQINQINF
ncbi:YncE family protein [Chitinophaga sp. 30R24]|uniref:YncE family protein n=1 Tax=Chitinophaga sp. 30R24 TaxID=3248838 RepID=UPI003B8FDE2D